MNLKTIKNNIEKILKKECYKNNITRRDVEFCLLVSIQKYKSFLLTHDDYALTHKEQNKFDDFIYKLSQGMPLAYVLGNQYFYKYKYFVDKNVLIPRSETEILIPKILDYGDRIYKKKKKLTLIDLGAGSGCIGLSIAKERKSWKIILSEKYTEAAKILRKNYNNFNLNNCYIVLSNWLKAFDDSIADIIVSNPPYISHKSAFVENSVKNFEPMNALYSKDMGFHDIQKIILESKKVLNKDGLLFLENGYNQSNRVINTLRENSYEDINTILDYNNICRFTLSRNTKNG